MKHFESSGRVDKRYLRTSTFTIYHVSTSSIFSNCLIVSVMYAVCRLSSCSVTEEGCSALTSALNSNHYHLRELDLSYNNPGEAGVKMLKQLRLDTLRCAEAVCSHSV